MSHSDIAEAHTHETLLGLPSKLPTCMTLLTSRHDSGELLPVVSKHHVERNLSETTLTCSPELNRQ